MKFTTLATMMVALENAGVNATATPSSDYNTSFPAYTTIAAAATDNATA